MREEEAQNDNIRLYIRGGEISKTISATYLGMTLRINGINDTHNHKRGETAIQRTKTLSSQA